MAQVVHKRVQAGVRDVGVGSQIPSSIEIGAWRPALHPAVGKIMVKRIEALHVRIPGSVPVRVKKARFLDDASIA
jgi:hypothetical protein